MFSRQISGPIKPLFLKISDSFSAFQRCVWCLLGDFVSLHCPLNAETKHLINKVGQVVFHLGAGIPGLGDPLPARRTPWSWWSQRPIWSIQVCSTDLREESSQIKESCRNMVIWTLKVIFVCRQHTVFLLIFLSSFQTFSLIPLVTRLLLPADRVHPACFYCTRSWLLDQGRQTRGPVFFGGWIPHVHHRWHQIENG